MGFFSSSKGHEHEPKQKLNTYNVLILLALAPGSICYGYTAAIIATTLGQPSFSEYFSLATRSNADALIGATSGLFFAGGTIGPLFLPVITDRKGRRWGIAISYILNIISGAFMAGSTNIGEFIFFRFVAGASAFMILGAIPLYMNEIVPPRMRGGLVELHAVFFILGFVIASWVGFGFSFWTTANLDAWRPPLAIQIFFPLVGLPCLYFMPESPRWLVLKGREEEAQAILHRLHGDNTAQGDAGARAEFYQIQKQLHIDKTLGNSWMHILRKPSYRKRVLYACGLTFFIQSSGDLVINNYSPLLYKNLGYGLVKQLLYPSAWLTWTFGISVIAIPLIDRFPRNKMTAVGLWFAGACLCCEAALVAEFVPSTNENALRAAVAMLFVFQIPDTLMLNGPEWAYLGELFPAHIRSKGYCAAMSVLALSNVVYTTAAPTAFAHAGWKFYLLFIIMTFIGGCTVWTCYPDTRSMPLEEIAAIFGDVDEVAVYQTEIEIDTAKNTIIYHHDDKGNAVEVEDAEKHV